MLQGLSGNTIKSKRVLIAPKPKQEEEKPEGPTEQGKEPAAEPAKDVRKKKKIDRQLLQEVADLSNRTSASMALLSAEKLDKQARNIAPVANHHGQKSVNPYDVHLLDLKEAILFSGEMQKYQFADYEPFVGRHLVITKTAIRVYENADKAVISPQKPLMAIPLAAVRKIHRVKFDSKDDERLHQDKNVKETSENMFEFFIKDEFLPILTHMEYTKAFKDQSVVMEKSPAKRSSNADVSKMSSPGRGSNVSRTSQFLSPLGASRLGSSTQGPKNPGSISMNSRGGHRVKESPSKAARITLQYINKYHDVGPKPKG